MGDGEGRRKVDAERRAAGTAVKKVQEV